MTSRKLSGSRAMAWLTRWRSSLAISSRSGRVDAAYWLSAADCWSI
jgi:hypothetical protein